MQDKLVTIFGGGGFLGRYVAQELLAWGARIRVAERDPGDAMHIRLLVDLGQTHLIAVDITRPASVARAVQGADIVINLVGILKGDFHQIYRTSVVAGKRLSVRVDPGGSTIINKKITHHTSHKIPLDDHIM